MRLIEEAWLVEGLVEFAVDGGYDTLYLAHGEHAPQETVAGVVALRLIAEHRHAMVYAHG